MGDKSKIEWTEATWNPVTGCSHMSEGCRHCYAERLSLRFGHTKKSWTAQNTAENVVCHEDRLDQPLRWRKPRMIFVNSMSDLFHERIPDDFIQRVFGAMIGAPQHTYQILTKRADRMADFLNRWLAISIALPGFKNIWLGVSVENQKAADERIPLLLQTPAAVRFLSCEPLLGPVDLTNHLVSWRSETKPTPANIIGGPPTTNYTRLSTIRWVIGGGESGPGARPMHPQWASTIRDLCVEADVPFFFKQWGEWVLKSNKPPGIRIGEKDFGVLTKVGNWYPGQTGWNGRDLDPDTGEAYMVRVGKKAAGRLLNGRLWNEFPETQP